MKDLTENEKNLIIMGIETIRSACKFSRGFGEKTKREKECEDLLKKIIK